LEPRAAPDRHPAVGLAGVQFLNHRDQLLDEDSRAADFRHDAMLPQY